MIATMPLRPATPPPLKRRGPFHIKTNSMPDALIMTRPTPKPIPPHAGTSRNTNYDDAHPPQALLVASGYTHDLRRAGLDILASVQKSRRFRRRFSGIPPTLGRTESEAIGRRATMVDLHVVILTNTDNDELSASTSAPSRSEILASFREAGARVSLHVTLLPTTSYRLSIASFASTSSSLRANLLRAFESDSLQRAFADSAPDIAALVCGKDDGPMEKEIQGAFMEAVATIFAHIQSRSPSPAITLYLPRHPFLSDFDLDLPSQEVRSLKVVQAASDQFTDTLGRFKPSHARNKSAPSALLTSQPDSIMNGGSVKPLLLRPAPSFGAQSIAVRLSLDTTDAATSDQRDVVLRVKEAQTPVSDTGTILYPLSRLAAPPLPADGSLRSRPARTTFGLRPFALSAEAPITPAYPTRIAIESAPSSPKASPPTLKLVIPARSIQTATPPLGSSFSPDSPTSSTGPPTPASDPEPVSAPWDPKDISPICKIIRKAGRQDTFDDEEMTASPHTKELQGLLLGRLRRAEDAARARGPCDM